MVSPEPPEQDAHYRDLGELFEVAQQGFSGPFQPIGLMTENSRFTIDASMVFGMAPRDDGAPA